jgi:glycosyltransferase involved in cell wall biosynthesis
MVVDVSVVIPTLNASRTLSECLRAVSNQTLKEFEIIVVDSYSRDDTVAIANKFGQVISADCGMTEARYQGALAASGRYVLNLDADQVLAPNTLKLAVAQQMPMVILGEEGYGRGLIARINSLEKRALHENWRQNVDPATGALRPRLYDRALLTRALVALPPELRSIRPCPYAEDSLIFMEASKRATGLGFVPSSVTHLEEFGVFPYLRKWTKYGRAARAYRGTSYEYLVRGRSFRRLKMARSPAAVVALAIRGPPFAYGYNS